MRSRDLETGLALMIRRVITRPVVWLTHLLERATRKHASKRSNLVKHAKRELELAGFYEPEADYGQGSLADSVLDLVITFSLQDHSGASAAVTVDLLTRLLRFDALTPLTQDPDEWRDVSELSGTPMWQSRRQFDVFSNDGGNTWRKLRQ